jgi:CRP-like cAMP-binding protein
MNEFKHTFIYLTDTERTALFEEAEHKTYSPGEAVLLEGAREAAIYLIVKGEARVERANFKGTREIAMLGPGEIFGEMSFVEENGASAAVVADKELEVIGVTGDAIRDTMEADPTFSGRFYQSIANVLSRRLRRTTLGALQDTSVR